MLYDENDKPITDEQKWENDQLEYSNILLKQFNAGQITEDQLLAWI
jgi:hypothetical protein